MITFLAFDSWNWSEFQMLRTLLAGLNWSNPFHGRVVAKWRVDCPGGIITGLAGWLCKPVNTFAQQGVSEGGGYLSVVLGAIGRKYLAN